MLSAEANENDLLASFADAPGVLAKMQSARILMARKRLAAVSTDDRFWRGVRALVEICHSGFDRDRLLAAELLVRLSKTLRTHRERIIEELKPALLVALPDLREMPSPVELGKEFKASEARENVALALSYIDYPWVPAYRLRALVQEDRSDEVRKLIATQIFESTDSLESTLDGIAHAIEQHTSEIFTPNAAARRTRDLLAAIAVGARSSLLDGTSEIGTSLDRVARLLLTRSGLPKDSKLIEECIEALAAATDEFLRSRVHLIIDGRSYQAMRLVSSWWGAAAFTDAVNLALAPIVKHLRGAVLLLARMSQRSEGLVDALTITLGGRAASAAFLQRLEEAHPEIDASIRRWMRAGGRDLQSSGVQGLERLNQAVSRELDVVLAEVMRDSLSLDGALAGAEDGVRGSRQTTPSDVTKLSRQLSRDIREVAGIRLLSTYGHSDQVVDYSPGLHEKADQTLPREAKVRIVKPAIVRVSGDKIVEVLLKAIVTEA